MTIEEHAEQFVSDVGGWMRSLREDHYEQYAPTDEETKAKLDALLRKVVDKCCEITENCHYAETSLEEIRRYFVWLIEPKEAKGG